VIPDTDTLIAVAEAAADVAGAAIRPYFRVSVDAAQKEDRSPVTVADRAAEQAMRTLLTERFPDHGVLGEEFGLDRAESALRWVLDPIDGTRAFITGRPTFGILIALFHDDRPILGIIDQPVTGERWIGAAGRRTVFRGGLGGRRWPTPSYRPPARRCSAPIRHGGNGFGARCGATTGAATATRMVCSLWARSISSRRPTTRSGTGAPSSR
jgi:myo-inositol-1(or 4)-monophosphatase